MMMRRYTNYRRFQILNKEMVYERKCEIPNYAYMYYKHQREHVLFWQELKSAAALQWD